MIAITSALSPGQHARIRLHLALIPAYICLVWNWMDLARRLPVGPGSDVHRVRDFAAIAYIPGVIANLGDASLLYDSARRADMLRALLPNGPLVRYPPFYGPQMSVLFSPLARLPYEWALAVWMAMTVIVYFACGYAIWTACPRLRDRSAAVMLLLLADTTLFYTLSFGQISAIALACVTGAFLALRANRRFLAGVFIGSLVYKPSLGVAFGIVLMVAVAIEWFAAWRTASLVAEEARHAKAAALRSRSRVVRSARLQAGPPRPAEAGHYVQDTMRDSRLVLGAIVGAAGQLAIGALFWGPSILREYFAAQVRLVPDMRDEFYLHHLHSWRGFFEIIGLPNAVGQTAYVIASVFVLALAIRCWRSAASLPVRFAALLIATVLVNPHGYVYDSIILMPAFLLLWDAFVEKRPIEWLLYFCYLSPLFTIAALVARVQLSVPALTLLMALSCRLRAAESVSAKRRSVST